MNPVETLKNYKKLSEVECNQHQLVKDKTIILYVATLLDGENKDVLTLCLDILENIVGNKSTHHVLVATFGLLEALESLSIRLRCSDPCLAHRAADMVSALRSSAPPAYSTRSRLKRTWPRGATLVYLIHMEELALDNRASLDEALLRIEGVVSFVVDVEHKRCTVRAGQKLAIRELASRIRAGCGMAPCLVTRDAEDGEVLTEILDEKPLNLEYLPEEDSPPKGSGSLMRALGGGIGRSANNWLKAVSNFWNENFYW